MAVVVVKVLFVTVQRGAGTGRVISTELCNTVTISKIHT